MQKLAELELDAAHRWRLEVYELPGGPIGLLLRGPRGQKIYIPPAGNEHYQLPKYIAKKLKPILPELSSA